MNRRNYLKQVKKIVVKVGTSIISTETGGIDASQLRNLVDQIAVLKGKGYQVVLVTSGAIAAGVDGLRLETRPTLMPELQAAASVGQGLLLHEYTKLFMKHDIKVGQVLITQYDTTHREHYLNARNTLGTLLDLGVVPVINENDTTAVDEIKFGDNDTLAALVTNLIGADLLIILTDTDGLYTSAPQTGEKGEPLSFVDEITEEVEALAGGVGTKFGLGGMVTKVQAAKIVTFARSGMIIANGKRKAVLLNIIDGKEVGTFFKPRKKKIDSRRLWIAFGKIPQGTIVVDEGAKKAILSGGKSLLPAGVVDCQGKFGLGDAVDIVDEEGSVVARGLTNFSAKELERIKGLKTTEVASKLACEAGEEVVHRDYLVILK